MRRLQLSRAVWVVTPLCFGPAVVHAQADSGAPASAELITQARAQLRARQLDSAAVLSSCLARNWARACVISSADAGAPLSACACTTAGPKQSGVTTQTARDS